MNQNSSQWNESQQFYQENNYLDDLLELQDFLLFSDIEDNNDLHTPESLDSQEIISQEKNIQPNPKESDTSVIKTFSPELPDIETLARITQHNVEYIQTLLKYPNMTPARLALILNYKEPPDDPYHHSTMNPSNKRSNQGYLNDKRNSRRRYLYRNRDTITNEFRKNFWSMICNVYNSGDANLLKSFIQTYYDPKFSLIKTIKDIQYSKKYCIYGRDSFYTMMSLLSQTSPDLIYILKEYHIKYHSKTKQTIFIAKMKQCGTRTKIVASLLTQILTRIHTIAQSWITLHHSTSSISSNNSNSNDYNQPINEKTFITSNQPTNKNNLYQHPIKNEFIDPDNEDQDDDNECNSSNNNSNNMYQEFTQYQQQLHTADTEIFETNRVSHMFTPYFNQMSPTNTQISLSFSQLFANINLYTMFQQMISQPNNAFVSLLSWFPSGIKVESDVIFYYYMNEHQKLIKLDVFVESIKLEISKGDYYR